jgi:cytidylate kinase
LILDNAACRITIDGPAASGKSTVALRLAQTLGYLYLDTGGMYRALTLEVLRRGISVDEEPAVVRVARETVIDIRPASVDDGRQYDVLLNGADVTWDIRSPQVDAGVSQVSVYPDVRRVLTARQREIGNRGRVVMAGRDAGTVVLPEAELKIYLDASLEERARRRYLESLERGEKVSYDSILENLRQRDRIDSSREVAPLKPAEDAVCLDTTRLTADEVLEAVLKLALSRRGCEGG